MNERQQKVWQESFSNKEVDEDCRFTMESEVWITTDNTDEERRRNK